MPNPCTTQCWAMPDCTTCGKRKAPRGRSVPLAAAGGYCDRECWGYYEGPVAGHLWPGEPPEVVEEPVRPEGCKCEKPWVPYPDTFMGPLQDPPIPFFPPLCTEYKPFGFGVCGCCEHPRQCHKGMVPNGR